MTRRLLLALAIGASALAGTGASACTIDQCWFSKPVCDHLSGCHVCYTEPQGPGDCITAGR